MTTHIADRTLRDTRAALRGLRRAPAFTATAIVLLSLGIGLASAMATVMKAVLITPLPVTAPDRIAILHVRDALGTDLALMLNEFKQLRVTTRTMSAVAGEAHFGASATTRFDGDRALVLRSAWVTGNFFDVLGARPALGRFFHEEEESLGEPAVLVISYATWKRQFAGDSSVLGRRLTSPYSHQAATIVGVGPPGLDYPPGVEYWSPIVYTNGLDVVARLAPGSTPAAARAEFATVMENLYRQGPVPREIAEADVLTLPQAVLGDVHPWLLALSAATALLLVIACVNIGGLLLLRLSIRQQEITVRRALGAGPSDIVGLLVAESTMLAVAGGIVGYGLSWLVLRLLPIVALSSLPRLDVIPNISGPSIAGGITLLVVVLIGAFPSLGARRSDLATPLRHDARAGGVGRGHRDLRRWCVATQVAIALVLLSGAGLLTHSLERLEHIDLGYRADHLSLLTLTPPVTFESVNARFSRLLERVPPALQAVPGISAATPIEIWPFFGPGVFYTTWDVEGQPASQAGHGPRLPFEVGGKDYFKAFEIPLLRGRGFLDSDRDSAIKVAVVSEGAARALGLGVDPIGARIREALDSNPADWRVVVGVVGDVHYRALRSTTPAVYLPAQQWFFQGIFAVRSATPLSQLLPSMKGAVSDAYAGAKIIRAETMDDLLADQIALPRASTSVLAAFSMGALLLAAVGVYGIVAATVRERTRELGIRAVLGATPRDLRRQVLREAFLLYAAGAGGGVVIALVLTRFLKSLLFQVSPVDPATLLGAVAILWLVALVAALEPARRATRIDPALALRAE